MFCSKCGMHNREGATCCISCGSSLVPEPAPELTPELTQELTQELTSESAPEVIPELTPETVRYGPPEAVQYYEVTYAGFWKRFAAALIDGFFLKISTAIIGVIAGIAIDGSPDSTWMPNNSEDFTPFDLITLVIYWLYFTLMESSTFQATPGKMALGIKVTDLEGNQISFARANGRYWSKLISTIILLIGYIMAGFTEKKQALHDLIAKTLVINQKQ
ncbi:MAG: RDD family protein [Chitinophagales bacterium]